MHIYINDSLRELQGAPKIADALHSLNITSHNGMAIAINNEVIPRSEWDKHPLRANDKMMLIKATQGG